MGLGLFLARTLVDSLSGQLADRLGVPARGTTIRVVLPQELMSERARQRLTPQAIGSGGRRR